MGPIMNDDEMNEVSVPLAALRNLINEAASAWSQRDQEFCVGQDEYEASNREWAGLIDALGVPKEMWSDD